MEVVERLISVAPMRVTAVRSKMPEEVQLASMSEGESDPANLVSERQFPGPTETRPPVIERPKALILTAVPRQSASA